MTIEEKNELVEDYINRVVDKLEKNNIKITQEQKSRVLNLFLNSDKSIQEIVKEIDTLVDSFLNSYKEIQERNKHQRHHEINELFDCRFTDKTLHIHVVPESIKEDMAASGGPSRYLEDVVSPKLDDALEKIIPILEEEENKDVDTVVAISPLLRLPQAQEIFKKRGFDVKLTQEQKFVEMFNTDRIGEASISKDKLLELHKPSNNELDIMVQPQEEKQEVKQEEKPKVYVKENNNNNNNNSNSNSSNNNSESNGSVDFLSISLTILVVTAILICMIFTK